MAGKYFEDLEVGMRFRHQTGRTVTEFDNVIFSSLTMNPQSLHLNEDFSQKTMYGQRIVNGIFTLGLVVGLSVSDLTEGTIIANLSYEHILHPRPVFHGDTIYAETEILEKRLSQSKPDRGIVKLRQIGRNQKEDIVVELQRTVIFLCRPT